MKKDLTILDDKSKFMKIFTKADENLPAQFHSLDPQQLEKIAERMPEIHRATRSFGRKNTQTTNKLMTLNMVSASPYRRLRQCVAQIERKSQALQEAYFKRQREQIKLAKLQDELGEAEGYDKELKAIEITEINCKLADGMNYIEGALKEISAFQEAYEQIRTNNNIPKTWDEQDFEEAELSEHVRTIFIHSKRDIIAHGRLGMGTLEYIFQLGLLELAVTKEVGLYLTTIERSNSLPEDIDINYEYAWLDEMVEKYKNEYKKALKNMGLDSLINIDILYKE